jgi:hypothetical protein
MDRQGREAAGQTRDDAEGDAGLREGQRFLAAAAEDEGIAALEPQDPLALAGERDEPLADVPLNGRGLAPALAGEFELRSLPGKGQHRRIDERVVHDDVRGPERVHGMDREQAGIARAGPDQPDRAGSEGGRETGQGGHASLRVRTAFTGWLLEFMGTM